MIYNRGMTRQNQIKTLFNYSICIKTKELSPREKSESIPFFLNWTKNAIEDSTILWVFKCPHVHYFYSKSQLFFLRIQNNYNDR